MEIVKLIGSDVLPDDQKLTLEIARVVRLGYLQQNAFHKDDTCVPIEKQAAQMRVILYLYDRARSLVTMGHPMSVLKQSNIFDLSISCKPSEVSRRTDFYFTLSRWWQAAQWPLETSLNSGTSAAQRSSA